MNMCMVTRCHQSWFMRSTKSNNEFVVDRILADGAYDNNDTFRCLSHSEIIPGIKVRKNSRVRKDCSSFKEFICDSTEKWYSTMEG